MTAFDPVKGTLILKNRKIRITRGTCFTDDQTAADIANEVKVEVKEQLKIETLITKAVKIDHQKDNSGL